MWLKNKTLHLRTVIRGIESINQVGGKYQVNQLDGGVDSYYTVNLPLEMSDVKYSIILGVGGKNVSGGFNSGYRDQTTTSFTFIFHNSGTSGDNYGSWQVSGMAA